MLPEHMPVLTVKEAEDFIRQDKKPLTEKQKAFLDECLAIYDKNPII
jgi:hypothetical protein